MVVIGFSCVAACRRSWGVLLGSLGCSSTCCDGSHGCAMLGHISLELGSTPWLAGVLLVSLGSAPQVAMHLPPPQHEEGHGGSHTVSRGVGLGAVQSLLPRTHVHMLAPHIACMHYLPHSCPQPSAHIHIRQTSSLICPPPPCHGHTRGRTVHASSSGRASQETGPGCPGAPLDLPTRCTPFTRFHVWAIYAVNSMYLVWPDTAGYLLPIAY